MSRKSSILDTDIILKIGGFTEDKLLRKVLLKFQDNLYIHEYLLNEELIFGESAIDQLHEMVRLKEITVLCVSELSDDELFEYESALNVLATEMNVNLKKKRDKNAGEIKSMAMAFAKDFECFISDDVEARVAAKKYLQKIDGSHLITIRMRDIITFIRANQDSLEISRKTARKLYLYGTSPRLARNLQETSKLNAIREHLKVDFDEKLWPI